MPEIERDGEELPRLSPGVGCDSTAQGDKVKEKNVIGKLNVKNPIFKTMLYQYATRTEEHDITTMTFT